MKKMLSWLLALVMILGLVPSLGEDASAAETPAVGLPAVGDTVEGFVVREIREYSLIGAQIVAFEHEKTGAKLLYVANSDTNRAFQLTFITRMADDKGLPHVFEHATLSGSDKYPSTSLWNNAAMQTYNTYMNAYTMDAMTSYPVASLSEAQLLKLADMYTDMCLNPRILEDESIYRTEAWRYELSDADAELTYNGTVYSEMLGARTIGRAGLLAANKVTFPGASVSYEYGGDPDVIPEMTWDELKAYHAKYYHPSNCLALLYGAYEDYTAFLKMLDTAFAPFEREVFSFEEPDYARIEAPVVATYAYPVAEGSNTDNQTDIFYYILCPGMRDDIAQEQLIDHACVLLNGSGSPLLQALKEAFPSGTFSFGREVAAPDDAILFMATNVNEGDADAFKKIVDETLAAIVENGFAPELVDNVVTAQKFDAKLASEDASPVDSVLSDLSYYYAVTGNLFRAVDNYEALNNIEAENGEGQLTGAMAQWLLNPELYTLTTASPAPGEKEAHDEALRAQLAEIKAAMTDEEKQALIDAADAPAVADDTDAMLQDLIAVTVATLPEEVKTYEMRDETAEGGFRRIEAVTGVDGISYVSLNLDAAALPQEDIHYMRLFTRLLGKMDTDAHTWQELEALIPRYLYQNTFGVFCSGWQEAFHPYAVAEWYSLDEDLEAGYALAEEILYHTQFTDVKKLQDLVTAQKATVRNQINSSPLSVLLYRQLGISGDLARYYNYLNYVDYYLFLEQLEQTLQENPQEVVSSLERVQQFFANRSGAIAATAGSEASLALNRTLTDAFFAKLADTPREIAAYDLPAASPREGLIADTNIQFNIVAAPWATIDPEADGAASAALGQLVSDMLLWPDLRDQAGAYGAYCVSDEQYLYIYTYRDPNVAETFAYFEALPDKVAALSVEQDKIDNYIISTYSSLAQPQGDMTGAVSALTSRISGIPDDLKLRSMRALKTATPESLKEFAARLAAMMNLNIRGTAGGAAAVTANAELYDTVLNPFHVEAQEVLPIADVPEDHPNAEAIAEIVDAGAMTAAEGAFRPDDPAQVGDLAYAFYVLGMGAMPEDGAAAYETFVSYGLMLDGADAADELSFDALNAQLQLFLKVGYDLDFSELFSEPFSGAGDMVLRGELAQVLYDIWIAE